MQGLVFEAQHRSSSDNLSFLLSITAVTP